MNDYPYRDVKAHTVGDVLDFPAGRAIRRFSKRVRAAAKDVKQEAAIDLRATRAVTSDGWAAMIVAIRELNFEGCEVMIVAAERLQALLQLSSIARHARLVIVPEAA